MHDRDARRSRARAPAPWSSSAAVVPDEAPVVGRRASQHRRHELLACAGSCSCRRSRAGPDSAISPSSMKTLKSPISRAKLSSWVTITIVMPDSATRAHDGEHLADELGVERRGRLVEQHHLRVEAERARDRDALLLAARELGRVARRRSAAGRPAGAPAAARSSASRALHALRTERSGSVDVVRARSGAGRG